MKPEEFAKEVLAAGKKYLMVDDLNGFYEFAKNYNKNPNYPEIYVPLEEFLFRHLYEFFSNNDIHIENYFKEEIPEKAFAGLHISSVNLNSTIRKIASWAFSFCDLKHIELPDSLEVIDSCAFFGANLDEVVIPKNVIEIGADAFGGCDNLKEVRFQGIPKKISGNAFKGCKNLTDIYFNCLSSQIKIPKRKFGAINAELHFL